MENKYFYQDFLYNGINYHGEMPNIHLNYISTIPKGWEITRVDLHENTDNKYKYSKDSIIAIRFTMLMNLTKKGDWELLTQASRKVKQVIIIDDICIKNAELQVFKEFFLKTYSFIIHKYCNNVVIVKEELIHLDK